MKCIFWTFAVAFAVICALSIRDADAAKCRGRGGQGGQGGNGGTGGSTDPEASLISNQNRMSKFARLAATQQLPNMQTPPGLPSQSGIAQSMGQEGGQPGGRQGGPPGGQPGGRPDGGSRRP